MADGPCLICGQNHNNMPCPGWGDAMPRKDLTLPPTIDCQARIDAAVSDWLTKWRRVVAAITGNQSATRCDACRATGLLHCTEALYGCSGMRDYTADEVLKAMQARIDAAVKAEREAIIYEVVEMLEHICEEQERRYDAALCRKIAAAIRERT